VGLLNPALRAKHAWYVLCSNTTNLSIRNLPIPLQVNLYAHVSRCVRVYQYTRTTCIYIHICMDMHLSIHLPASVWHQQHMTRESSHLP
jgi:hypothetical protein